MKFESLSLCKPLLRTLQNAGYDEATPIQQQAIPQLLKGRDLVGCAQTGTGKTAAFALPTLQHLMGSATTAERPQPSRRNHRSDHRSDRRPIRSLILAPTRELAGQIGDSLKTYGRLSGLRHTVIYGGVHQGPQVRDLKAGVDILVATPGRLLDLIGQGFVKLAKVEILILDEADQMLDMGFVQDLHKIVAYVPKKRQTLMFSATMPKEIRELADRWLNRPFEVNVAPIASTPERVSQSVCFVERHHKAGALRHLLQSAQRSKTIVFARTKRGADKIVKWLLNDGIRAVAIHGDKSQSRRKAVMRESGSRRPPVLVATDLAARGLDFSEVSQVVNYELPEVAETYVHRIGRTARAGASGHAVSFCARDEIARLRTIEKLIGQRVDVMSLPDSRSTGQADGQAGKAEIAEHKRAESDGALTARPHVGSKRNRKSKPYPRNRRSAAKGSASSPSKTGKPRSSSAGKRKKRPRAAAAAGS